MKVCKIISLMVRIRHRMKWCELREYKWNEYVTIAVNRNLSNCEKAWKEGFRGFNGIRTHGLWVSAAVLYQPELWRPIHWRPANLLSSSSRERNETQNEMMWTAGIQMKWVCDHRSESQFKQLRKSLKKRISGLRWSHTHFICIPAVHIISFCVSFLSRLDELNWPASYFLSRIPKVLPK